RRRCAPTSCTGGPTGCRTPTCRRAPAGAPASGRRARPAAPGRRSRSSRNRDSCAASPLRCRPGSAARRGGSDRYRSLIFNSRWFAVLAVLDVQVPHFERVVLNERPPWLDFVAHQDGKDRVGFDVVLDADAEQAALGGIHGGLPELRRVHLAQALVALDREA